MTEILIIRGFDEKDPDADLSKEHCLKKAERSRSMMRQQNRRHHQLQELQHAGSKHTKPSIYADIVWSNDEGRYVYNGRVGRQKHSHNQKFLKRYSNKVIRRTPHSKVSLNGNYNRKLFDYWWIWL